MFSSLFAGLGYAFTLLMFATLPTTVGGAVTTPQVVHVTWKLTSGNWRIDAPEVDPADQVVVETPVVVEDEFDG
jgi:hypothetical protein